MKVRFLETEKEELDDAAGYYELEFEGLGDRFKNEVKLALRRIVSHPRAWSLELEDVRKCLLINFLTKYSIRLKRIIF